MIKTVEVDGVKVVMFTDEHAYEANDGVAPATIVSCDHDDRSGITTMVIKEKQDFVTAVRPMIKWLAENEHPHTTVILTSTGAELVEGKQHTGKILDYIVD